MTATGYHRILLKISGESLSGEGGYGINPVELGAVAQRAAEVVRAGKQLAIVTGGGNIMRGAAAARTGTLSRVTADHMGMLATVINGLALCSAIEETGTPARVMSALPIGTFVEPFGTRGCLEHLDAGRVVVLAGGTGNPFFTTDTTAALRATEIGADVLLKATKVDGIYSGDPKTDPNAKKYDRISYMDVLTKQLKVMDAAAIALCQENKIPIVVFSMNDPKNFEAAISGQPIGTYVGE